MPIDRYEARWKLSALAEDYGHERVLYALLSHLSPDQSKHFEKLLQKRIKREGWKPAPITTDQTDFLLP